MLDYVSACICEIEGKWPHNSCFIGCCFKTSKQRAAYLCSSFLTLSSSVSLNSLWFYCTLVLTRLQNSNFISSERSDFFIIDKLSAAVHVLSMRILTSLSVDETLLLTYVNRSTNFRGFPFNEEIALS